MDRASSSYYYSPCQYHYQPAPYFYNHSPEQRVSSVSAFLFLATMSLLAATALISLCESAVEILIHQLRGFVILSPVLIILAVHLWVCSGGGSGGVVSLVEELMTGDQTQTEEQYYYAYRCHRGSSGVGSPPWGVALALVLVLFLISYQPSIHERWFWPVTAAVVTIIGVTHGRIDKNS